MSLDECLFCNIRIYWARINGKNKPFEDSDCIIPHICPNIVNSKNKNGDRVLLRKTITRVSQLEKRFAELEKLQGFGSVRNG